MIAMRRIVFPLLVSAGCFVGCTLAPSYRRPEAPIPRAWPGEADVGQEGRPASETAWADFVREPRLQGLIRLALENNRDLRVAALNVEAARAQYRIQRAALLPAVDATGSGTRARTPGSLTGSGQAAVSSSYAVSVGATAYELDLFGRVQSLRSKALETYLAREETKRSVQLTLVSEVADQYLAQRALVEQLELAQRTLAAVSASRDLTKKSYEAGNVSELDYQSAEAQVQTARSNVANYQLQLAASDTALSLLVGRSLPGDLPAPSRLEETRFLRELSPGLPSDLLQRRPDILAAEHTLKAANADIGAARAAFFPKISLTGSAGTASSELSGLFDAGSGSWSFAPSVTLPIFAAGSNKATLDVAKLETEVEIATYEKAIQTAFKEVADALSAKAPLEERLSATRELVAAQRKRFDLAQVRYRSGADSYLSVLSAQQDLYAAQQSLISVQLARLSNLVALYKALGGGWR